MGAQLTVNFLLRAGFQEVGCWTASAGGLDRPADLPARRGAYAFALEEQVVYVGLASRSLSSRLAFYARPGSTQRTNIRLNGMIAELIAGGEVVRILFAHPKDGEWNGLRVSGPEGLEAALIEDFDLPWNVRGSTRKVLQTKPAQEERVATRRPNGATRQAILDFVATHPNCTELEIAKGIFGPSAVQQQANAHCRRLLDEGKLERLPTRPATYRLSR